MQRHEGQYAPAGVCAAHMDNVCEQYEDLAVFGKGGIDMNTNDTREIKSKSEFNSIVTIRGGKVRAVTGSYIYIPRTHFSGGTVKWFDDTKLVKGDIK